jgi:cytochrome c oxidase subunit 3
MEILKLDLIFESNGISTFLFIFSGVHFVYVLAGVVMSALLFYKYMLIENDPVKTLITTTNPHEKIKLEIFRSYWNFNVFSWTLIFLMLLFIF